MTTTQTQAQTQTHVTFTCAACGDTFTITPEYACMAGYAVERLIDADGTHERKYCYPCAALNERANAHETGELFAYVKGVSIAYVKDYAYPWRKVPIPRKEKGACLTTWPGIKLANISAAYRAYRSNFGDIRIAFTFTLDGEQWHGTYYASAGDYARCKRNKAQAAQTTTGGNN